MPREACGGAWWLRHHPLLTSLPPLPGGAVSRGPLGPSRSETLRCALCSQVGSPSEGDGPDSATSGRTDALSLSRCSPGFGFGALGGGLPRVAAHPIWGGANWMRAGFPKRGTPCMASPRSSGVGGAGGLLFSARSSQVVRLCLYCPSLTAPEKAATSRNAPSMSSPKQRSKQAGSPPRPPPGLWYLAVAPSAPAPPAFAYISSVPVLPYPSATV